MKNKGNGVVECARWPGYFISAQFPERDEPKDEVEASDYRHVFHGEVADEPTRCLGPACPMTANTCEVCLLAEGRPKPAEQKKSRSVGNPDQATSLAEARLEARLAAPTARGRRGILAGQKLF